MPLHADVRAALEATGVPFEVLACEPNLADTAVFCDHYGYSPEQSVNTIIVAGKRDGERHYAACVVIATTRVDVNKTVRKQLGVRRISFATAEETMTLTGMTLGGVTAIALPEDLPIYVDHRIMQCEYIILGGGNRESKIKISPTVFDHLPTTTVLENVGRPIE